jgi:cytochrome bd ubiquinol oxidase subunit II
MPTLWFVIVALMLVAYVVLDGFDLGAGALHLVAARTDADRRAVLASIGPVWDGNEVWLLAAGGTLYYAFPLLYASSFSGFYLALNIVVWLLLFRAIGIEFRHHLSDPLWTAFFDGAFSLASVLLIVFFGAAFGNVMRGVPLEANRYFFLPLWTDFRPGPQPGVLDWYTIFCAVVTLIAVAVHGALYLIMKTEGELNARLRSIVKLLWPALTILMVLALLSSLAVRSRLIENYRSGPAGWIVLLGVGAGLAGIPYFTAARRERSAFLSSCLFIVATLAGAAYALYPDLLPSSADPANSVTISNAAAGPFSLSVGLIWWAIGMAMAVGYFVIVFRMFRGKVALHSATHG